VPKLKLLRVSEHYDGRAAAGNLEKVCLQAVTEDVAIIVNAGMFVGEVV
jgi:hypothetical protein